MSNAPGGEASSDAAGGGRGWAGPTTSTSSAGLRELLSVARELALRAGREHLAGLREALAVESKSSPTDLVSQVDRRAEEAIVARLARLRPRDAILAEEGAAVAGSSGVRWVIDPLDGTTNYVYGYPGSCVSIAVEVDGAPRIGVVHEPAAGRTYEAVAGGEASCDGRPLAVRSQTELAHALVATGFSYDAGQRALQAVSLAHILPRVRDIRRAGSAALDLCHLAAGRVDAYYELDLNHWDTAAGSVIAAAAGADVLALPAAHGRGPAVVAASPALLPALLTLLREAAVLA